MDVTIEPYGDHSTVDAPNSGVEVRWDTSDGAGYIDIPQNGEPSFTHGDGFRFFMAGDDTRIETESGRRVWHVQGGVIGGNYDVAIRVAADLIYDGSDDNMTLANEYTRGICEVLGDLFGKPGVELGVRKEQILHDINIDSLTRR